MYVQQYTALQIGFGKLIFGSGCVLNLSKQNSSRLSLVGSPDGGECWQQIQMNNFQLDQAVQ